MALDPSNSRKRLHQLKNRLEKRLRQTSIIVVLLGAGGTGLAERRRISRRLASRGLLPLIPEDDFPRHVSPSLVEEAMLSKGDVDLIFLNVQSWGSATELGQFHRNRKIAPKLRILVPPAYHPLHGRSTSYLTDVYLNHLTAFGHVYAVNGKQQVPVPSARTLIVKMSERYRQLKVLRSGLIK